MNRRDQEGGVAETRRAFAVFPPLVSPLPPLFDHDLHQRADPRLPRNDLFGAAGRGDYANQTSAVDAAAPKRTIIVSKTNPHGLPLLVV